VATIILECVLWLPAIVGWGLPAFWLRRRVLAERAPAAFDIVEPLAGLAFLGAFATLLNFWAPVNQIAWLGLALGWAGLGVRLWRSGWPRVTWAQAAAGVAFLGLLAYLCRGPLRNYDSGLYYVTAVEWMRQNVAPLGLANLHGRIGFGSLWLAVVAALGSPLSPDPVSNYHVAPALITWLWGMAAFQAAGRVLRRPVAAADVFLAVSLIGFLSGTFAGNLPSPATDMPVVPLGFVLVYLGLRAYAATDEFHYLWWATVVIAAFAALSKTSAGAWLLLPAALAWARGRQRGAGMNWRVLGAALVAAGALAVPWLARGIVVSGCLVYPVEFTCVSALPWSVPLSAARSDALWVLSWARQPGVPSQEVLSSLAWLRPWFGAMAGAIEVQLMGVTVVTGLVVLGLSLGRARLPAAAGARGLGLVGLVILLGCVSWFLTAPDLRFGAGYLWSASLWPLTAGLVLLSAQARPTTQPRLNWRFVVGFGLAAGLAAAAWVGAINVIAGHTEPLRPGDLAARDLPAGLAPDHEVVPSANGEPIYRPRRGDQCWFIRLPCTPYRASDLHIVRRADGQVAAIYR
jgi:hypothetical protein